MKKFFLLVITILPTLLAAQSNGVTISNFAVGSGKVTFDIGWNRGGMPILWRDSVWVFVDYNNAGVMTRLPLLTEGAKLTATSAPGIGKVEAAPDNNKQGVWVIGNAKVAASGSFSATVELPFSGSNVSGACVYASNYPPYGTWVNSGTQLSLSGTAPYTLHLQGPTELHPVILGNTYDLPVGYSMSSFTDATGAPGLVNCIPPTAPESLTASIATVCSGGLVTLTANGGQTGSGSQFEWGTGNVVGSGNFAVTAIGSTTATPTSSTTYWVRRVSTDGCGTTTAATHTVTVDILPTVSSSTGVARCGTGTVSISATASANATIDWYATANNGAVLANGTATNSFTTPGISTSTTYYAQARNTGTNCVSASRTAVLASVNTVPVTPVISQPQSVCQGTDLVFTISGTPLSGGSYSWTGSVGAVSGAGSVTYTASGATTGAKTVTVNVKISENGITCTSLESEKVSATVGNLPMVSTTVNGSRCGAGAVLISATPSGGAVIDWYADLSGGTALTTASNTYTTPTISTSTTYYAAARVGSCISAARTAVGATVNTTIPTINTQPTPLTQKICPGSTVSLSVTAANASAYQWKNGSSNASGTGTTTAAFTGTVSANSTFTVVVASAAGCSVTSNQALVTTGNAPGETVTIAAFNPCQVSASSASTWTVIDSRDSKQYKVVMMPDNRVWFAQNLNYQQGLTFNANSNQAKGVSFVTYGSGTAAIGSFWCPAAISATSSVIGTCDIYGALYTWETAMMPDGKVNASVTAWNEAWVSGYYYTSGAPGSTANAKVNLGRTDAGAVGGRGICPVGWHVPTEYEWANMLDKVDNTTVFTTQSATTGYAGTNEPGRKIKSTATASADAGNGSWISYSGTTGTNSTGFNVLPAGRRFFMGSQYADRSQAAYLWSSSVMSESSSWYRVLEHTDARVMRVGSYRATGESVRCLKDN